MLEHDTPYAFGHFIPQNVVSLRGWRNDRPEAYYSFNPRSGGHATGIVAGEDFSPHPGATLTRLASLATLSRMRERGYNAAGSSRTASSARELSTATSYAVPLTNPPDTSPSFSRS
jgi:hypothetical protein